jgi:hypothetical protein
MSTPRAAGRAIPLLVTGMERSGTTLLRTMLSGHPAVCRHLPPFVVNLFRRWPDGVADPAALDVFLEDLYTRTRFGRSPVSRDELRARVAPRLPLSFRELAFHVTAAHSERLGKSGFTYWGEGTPHLVPVLHAHRAALDRALGAYRVIAIVRDGRAVLASVLRAQAVMGQGFATDVIALAARWRQAVTLGRLFPDPARYHELRYEDLVTQPEATLRGVCQFLGVPWEPAMLAYPELGVRTPIHALLAAPPSPARATAWSREGPPVLLRIFDWLARDELRRLGYPALPAGLGRPALLVRGELLRYWMATRVGRRLPGAARPRSPSA